MNKKGIFLVILSLFLSSFVFFIEYKRHTEPKELYRVYLKGETIGYIENKDLLEKYIDEEQYELKEKYHVDKVFLPNDLDIVKEITYGKRATSEKVIYEKIKDRAPFTITGYTITIKGLEEMSESDGQTITTPDKKIYVIDRDLFEKSVKNTVSVFISENDYQNFLNKTQAEIKDVGSIIEDIYIKNQITITEGKISTEEKIFTDVNELDKYLLFGTVQEQQKYTVKAGDSISDIAYKNKLSVDEFLIANPEFTSANNLLYEGQVVNLGLINPLFKLIEEDHVVELQTKRYETKVEYDNNILVGYEKVKQEGEDGTLRITKKVQKVNGEFNSAVITKTEVIKEAVPKIVIKGNKVIPSVGNVGVWAWPAAQPYCISSSYGWRWGKLHEGVDIACSGYGSPIYAANNGTVVVANNNNPWPNGNYVIINHNNGYYSMYAHLAYVSVKEGQVVEMGEKIGAMGHSGYATGTHLHFGISRGYPYYGGTFLNPMQFYK